jgi:hypothetical protein
MSANEREKDIKDKNNNNNNDKKKKQNKSVTYFNRLERDLAINPV